ncbi:uncharacterized protein LOC123694550 [Colias croceus]|uniref:uncharacterized protein LOC123694550 n=1 Tax=Colias crocea TaxID=72248 RepID=UPI001E27CCD5|nr:uncharacterized protein LOC123694550 [Colias croceus]
MGSRLSRSIIEEHDIKPESTTYWTDNWRWVPTKLNVADDATRDVPIDFSKQHRWFTGPPFLRDDPSTWPTERPTIETPTGEERVNLVISNVATYSEAVPDPKRFSKWERLLRSTARILQFIDLCRPAHKTCYGYRRNRKNQQADADWNSKNTKKKIAPGSSLRIKNVQQERRFKNIESEHLRRAEELLVRVSQHDSFSSEIANMEKGKLRALSIEIEDGLLKIKSRISATEGITPTQSSPPVICGDHHIAKLYIEYVHRRLHHAGAEATINECRAKYWITRLRPITRSIVHKCIKCHRRRSAPATPPTGNLPQCRLAHHRRPFSYTGLDYFGPLTVTVGRVTQKRYVSLFTCLTTRAVHLELANTLSTESAVMAIRRFIARRGCPTEIWSDNGTNLHGAEKELRHAIQDASHHEASMRAINWRFIPPGAPFMGGAWERLVRSVKTALYASLNQRHPREEILLTLLAEVEFTVNNRPLTHVSVNPEDPEALTPNHFLLLGPAMNPAPGSFTNEDLIGRKQWRTAQRLADMFWERWLREYLPELQQRRDPHGRGKSPQIGDVVLIVDNTMPRNTWPMGRVSRIYPGNDGVTRVADVQTRGGELRRPVKKMVVLVENCPSPVNK